MSDGPQIADLQGVAVSSVCFVQDYVELHFDGPILRCLANPILRLGGEEIAFPQHGSRDALCGLIGQTVEDVLLDEGHQMEMRFSSGSVLFLLLEAGRRIGPEAMHFVPVIGGPIQVW